MLKKFPLEHQMSKDLGLKIGSPEEAAWKKVLNSQKEAAINAGINKEVAEALVILAEQRIEEEKEKFKK